MKNIYLLLLIAISYESLGNDAEIKDSGIKLISAGLAISSHLKNDLPDEYTTHTEGGALNLSFKYFSGVALPKSVFQYFLAYLAKPSKSSLLGRASGIVHK